MKIIQFFTWIYDEPRVLYPLKTISFRSCSSSITPFLFRRDISIGNYVRIFRLGSKCRGKLKKPTDYLKDILFRIFFTDIWEIPAWIGFRLQKLFSCVCILTFIISHLWWRTAIMWQGIYLLPNNSDSIW